MFKSLFIVSLLLSNVPTFSQDIDPDLVITSVEVHQVANPVESKAVVELPTLPKNPVDEVAMYIDGIIAIGKKIWPIIDAGRPVITTSGMQPTLSILPHLDNSGSTSELNDMAGWSAPKVISYRVSYRNYFNKEVVGFTYTVYFQYNGSLNGIGKYITSLRTEASEIYSSWGFNFTASTELVSIANIGSSSFPVASAILQVSYIAKGLFNEVRNAQSFYVDGNGALEPLNK